MQRGLSATAELFFTSGSLTLVNKLLVLCKDLFSYGGLHLAFMLTFTADVLTWPFFLHWWTYLLVDVFTLDIFS